MISHNELESVRLCHGLQSVTVLCTNGCQAESQTVASYQAKVRAGLITVTGNEITQQQCEEAFLILNDSESPEEAGDWTAFEDPSQSVSIHPAEVSLSSPPAPGKLLCLNLPAYTGQTTSLSIKIN